MTSLANMFFTEKRNIFFIISFFHISKQIHCSDALEFLRRRFIINKQIHANNEKILSLKIEDERIQQELKVLKNLHEQHAASLKKIAQDLAKLNQSRKIATSEPKKI